MVGIHIHRMGLERIRFGVGDLATAHNTEDIYTGNFQRTLLAFEDLTSLELTKSSDAIAFHDFHIHLDPQPGRLGYQKMPLVQG